MSARPDNNFQPAGGLKGGAGVCRRFPSTAKTPCRSNNMKASFNTRIEYLAYRAQWKAEYKQLSADIRLFRLACSFSQRSRHKALTPAEEEIVAQAEKRVAPNKGYFSISSFLYQRHRLARRATEMLEELKEAKQEAQRQYLASKAVAG